MNKIGIVIIVLITLFVGYQLGKDSDDNSSIYQPVYISPTYSPPNDSSDSEEKLKELRSNLEKARDNTERARDAADQIEYQSRMRWFETGSYDDQMRMYDAEIAKKQANDALDSIENSISESESPQSFWSHP